MVVFVGAVNTTVAGVGTVNVLVQDCGDPQSSVAFQVTFILPPQIDGAVGFKGDRVTTRLVPPVALNVFNQEVKAELRADCDRQAADVVFSGQFNTTGLNAGCVIVCEVVVIHPSADSTVTV